MPKMSGQDLARRLRETHHGTPIVLTTGFRATMAPEKARRLGFSDLLPRPFSLQASARTVHRALAALPGGRWPDQRRVAPHARLTLGFCSFFGSSTPVVGA